MISVCSTKRRSRKEANMKYQVELAEVDLKQAVEIMELNLTVFYTYDIGKPIHLLDRKSLSTAIRHDAIFLTPSSFVEKCED